MNSAMSWQLCEDGRAPAVLALMREALNSGALDKADVLYAESLLAPTARASLAKLREFMKDYPGHYRGRVAFLGLPYSRSARSSRVGHAAGHSP
jgi:hypothetical protein